MSTHTGKGLGRLSRRLKRAKHYRKLAKRRQATIKRHVIYGN